MPRPFPLGTALVPIDRRLALCTGCIAPAVVALVPADQAPEVLAIDPPLCARCACAVGHRLPDRHPPPASPRPGPEHARTRQRHPPTPTRVAQRLMSV